MHPSALTAVAFETMVSAGVPNPANRALTFGRDGTFQISIFEDLHYGEAPSTYGPTQDGLTSKVITNILRDERGIDLAVINGDMISRDNLMPNSTGYLDQALKPLIDRGLTWASVYGNHESNTMRNVEDVFRREKRFRRSRTLSMAPGIFLLIILNIVLSEFEGRQWDDYKPEH